MNIKDCENKIIEHKLILNKYIPDNNKSYTINPDGIFHVYQGKKYQVEVMYTKTDIKENEGKPLSYKVELIHNFQYKWLPNILKNNYVKVVMISCQRTIYHPKRNRIFLLNDLIKLNFN